jgi:hypothetical protein
MTNQFAAYSNLTPDQYRELLDRVGITVTGAADFFGYDDRTVRRWAEGANPIPLSVAFVLYMMVAFEQTPQAVLALADRWENGEQ